MNEQSELLILDYLRRVGDVAHTGLRADERLDFLRRLRTRIDEMRESAGATEPEQVRRVLDRFGDPTLLVDRERARLERERPEAGAGAAHEPAVAPDAVPPSGAQGGDRATTEPIPIVGADEGRAARGQRAQSSESSADEAPSRPAEAQSRPAEAPSRSAEAQSPSEAQHPPDAQSPSEAQNPTDAQDATGGGPARSWARAARTRFPQARPRHSGPPLYEPHSPRQTNREAPSVASRLVARLPPDVRDTLRGGALEAAALVVLGLGAVLRPLPLWFIGAFAVGITIGWSVEDKLIGLLPAPLFAVLGTGLFVALGYGGEQSYLQVLAGRGWTFFQIGAVLGTAYLAVRLMARVRRRRSKRSPWASSGPYG